MANREDFIDALAPLLAAIRETNVTDPNAAAALAAKLPIDSPQVQKVKQLMREGVEAKWLCERENEGVRYSRVKKSADGSLSIDAVHMSGPGMAHTHPGGEFDLCFAVSGSPTFDGRPEGWTVYAPGSWHVPTVEGGVMDILYFLPAGAMQFGPRPEGSTAVGLQAKG
jgi:hypothetical protein